MLTIVILYVYQLIRMIWVERDMHMGVKRCFQSLVENVVWSSTQTGATLVELKLNSTKGGPNFFRFRKAGALSRQELEFVGGWPQLLPEPEQAGATLISKVKETNGTLSEIDGRPGHPGRPGCSACLAALVRRPDPQKVEGNLPLQTRLPTQPGPRPDPP